MAVHSIILDWLEKELFEGHLRLGQDLPDDREIAEATELTHSATREALKHLEDMGIVRLYEGRKKTIIAQLVEDPVASAAPALRLHTAQAKYPVRDLVQARMLIEGWAVENALAGHPALNEARDILDRMQEPNISLGEFYQLEVSFHMALVRSSANELLSGLMGAMRPALFDYLMSIAGTNGLWSTTAARLRSQHRATVDAIESGDNVTAATLLRAQIRSEYEEADIDLNAPRIPESVENPQPSLEPVVIEDEGLLPENPNFTISPSLIDALNTIEPVQARKPPVEVAEVAVVEEEKPDAPAAIAEELPGADEGLEKSEPTEQAEHEPETVKDGSFIRAENTGRRRSGTVSTPVHATVIKPISRTSHPTGMIAGQVASATQQAERGASTNVLRAKPRPATPVLPSSAELLEQQKQREAEQSERGFFHWRRKTKSVEQEQPVGAERRAEAPAEEQHENSGDETAEQVLAENTSQISAPEGLEQVPGKQIRVSQEKATDEVDKNDTASRVVPDGTEPVKELQHLSSEDGATALSQTSTEESTSSSTENRKRAGKLRQFFGWGLSEKPTTSKTEWIAVENTGAHSVNADYEGHPAEPQQERKDTEQAYIIENTAEIDSSDDLTEVVETKAATENNTAQEVKASRSVSKGASTGKPKVKKKKKRKR